MSYKIQSICRKFSLAASFLLLMQFAYTQKNFSEVDKAIAAQKKLTGNDLMVVVANADSVVWQKMYGDMTVKTQLPIFASSQWLTVALIMQLVDEGKFSLDDKLSQYLPLFESYGKGFITLRHCLTNLTGIRYDNGKLAKIFERKKFATLDEEMLTIAKREIDANPGLEFSYNNMGIDMAARVAEVVTKKKFDALIKQRLFAPMGMRNTTFSTLDASAPDPFAGAKTTALDYIKFLQMLLANGKFAGKQILSEAAVAEMRKLQIGKEPVKYVPKLVEGWGFVWGGWYFTPSPSPAKPARGVAEASVLVSPGFFGTWPWIDFGHGYVGIILPKNNVEDVNATVLMEVKKAVDKQL